MRFNRGWKGLALLAGLSLAVACSDTGAPSAEEEAQVTQDVMAYAADVTSDDVIMMTLLADGVLGSAPSAAPPFDGTISYSRSVTFYGEGDAVQDAYDPLLTAKVNMVVTFEGSRSWTGDRGTMSVTVARHRDMTVSNLLGEETERIWDGDGNSDVNRVHQSDQFGERVYDFTATTAVAAVVIPVPRGSGWPVSGTITRQVTVEVVSGLGDTVTRMRTVMVEFNGTHLVPITINDLSCTLDLALRSVSCG
ncbi:MAG: hypothetical protein OEO20_07675 [Gemmatimonadota bacterium]|nr:hypothetical protein [Gemmatimonadota bacterium]MDH3368346.1 hypothetical protein [Gemmatimonadota bacterium]MDH3478169.1 hypothetical protein [Gemmatimonadota bacterium]MDH3569408.1 hypothetical protein [Gemmatimonadota bacterium]MDH5549350.1 hypothetical protein [Gemmatimonadota bacterium]